MAGLDKTPARRVEELPGDKAADAAAAASRSEPPSHTQLTSPGEAPEDEVGSNDGGLPVVGQLLTKPVRLLIHVGCSIIGQLRDGLGFRDGEDPYPRGGGNEH